MNRTTPLKRSTTPLRRCPLQKVSKRQAKKERAKSEAYKEVKARVQWCESCGRHENLSPSHALTQKKWPQFAADPRNIFLLCWPCHYIWEHDKVRFFELAPDVFGRKLAIIKELSTEQYQLLANEYPDIIPDA